MSVGFSWAVTAKKKKKSWCGQEVTVETKSMLSAESSENLGPFWISLFPVLSSLFSAAVFSPLSSS